MGLWRPWTLVWLGPGDSLALTSGPLLGVALTLLSRLTGVPLPSSRRASAFPGSGIFSPCPQSSPPSWCSSASWAQALGKATTIPLSPLASARLALFQPGEGGLPHWDVDWPHVCMAEASPLGTAREGSSCSQRPPIFSSVYFNKINLTKERDSPWLYPDCEFRSGSSHLCCYPWLLPSTKLVSV